MNSGLIGAILATWAVVVLPLFCRVEIASTGMSPVRIQGLMALNQNGAVDECGEFDDYIKLANHGKHPINVGGMWLSDDSEQPQRWQIPRNTWIESGETLRIWADGEPKDGPLHASFRLNHLGERVLLFDAERVLVDAVVFPRLEADEEFSR